MRNGTPPTRGAPRRRFASSVTCATGAVAYPVVYTIAPNGFWFGGGTPPQCGVTKLPFMAAKLPSPARACNRPLGQPRVLLPVMFDQARGALLQRHQRTIQQMARLADVRSAPAHVAFGQRRQELE